MLDHSIFDDPAEQGFADIGAVEMDAAETGGVPHPHVAKRTDPPGGHAVPGAHGGEDPLRGAADGGDSGIEVRAGADAVRRRAFQ